MAAGLSLAGVLLQLVGFLIAAPELWNRLVESQRKDPYSTILRFPVWTWQKFVEDVLWGRDIRLYGWGWRKPIALLSYRLPTVLSVADVSAAIWFFLRPSLMSFSIFAVPCFLTGLLGIVVCMLTRRYRWSDRIQRFLLLPLRALIIGAAFPPFLLTVTWAFALNHLRRAVGGLDVETGSLLVGGACVAFGLMIQVAVAVFQLT